MRLEGDTNQIIKKKIESALSQKLNIIFCIGETFKEKIAGKTFSVLKKQMKDSIDKNFLLNIPPNASVLENPLPNISPKLVKEFPFPVPIFRRSFACFQLSPNWS